MVFFGKGWKIGEDLPNRILSLEVSICGMEKKLTDLFGAILSR